MDKDQHPEGYAVPLHRSLTQPIFWGGVPRNLLLLEVLVGIIGGIFFKTFLIPVLCIAAHYLSGSSDSMTRTFSASSGAAKIISLIIILDFFDF